MARRDPQSRETGHRADQRPPVEALRSRAQTRRPDRRVRDGRHEACSPPDERGHQCHRLRLVGQERRAERARTIGRDEAERVARLPVVRRPRLDRDLGLLQDVRSAGRRGPPGRPRPNAARSVATRHSGRRSPASTARPPRPRRPRRRSRRRRASRHAPGRPSARRRRRHRPGCPRRRAPPARRRPASPTLARPDSRSRAGRRPHRARLPARSGASRRAARTSAASTDVWPPARRVIRRTTSTSRVTLSRPAGTRPIPKPSSARYRATVSRCSSTRTGSNGCWTTPEFRPEAPAAISVRSSRRTRRPSSARWAAAATPTMPPPMTITSGAGRPRSSIPG